MSANSTKTPHKKSHALQAIQTLLELCLDEKERRGPHFDPEAWTWLEDAIMTAPVVAAWGSLDEFNDREHLGYLESLVEEYRMAVFPDPISDDAAILLACPLFAAELSEAQP